MIMSTEKISLWFVVVIDTLKVSVKLAGMKTHFYGCRSQCLLFSEGRNILISWYCTLGTVLNCSPGLVLTCSATELFNRYSTVLFNQYSVDLFKVME